MNKPELTDLPWIRRVRSFKQCSRLHNDTPPNVLTRLTEFDAGFWRCPNRGEYYFTAHNRSWSPSGIYCRDHLVNVAMIEPAEVERLNRWIRNHYPHLVKDVQNVIAPNFVGENALAA